MKIRVLIFVVSLQAYFEQAMTDVETVWLKDVTTRFQTDKRALSNPDLPDQLSFQLKSKSLTLTLNLKRNHQIDTNLDIYTLNKLNDGQSFLEKAQELETEDVAYYQDLENGAFVTARCVRRSNGQCEIQINGNIQIGDRMYDLEPSRADITSRDFMEMTGLLGKRYDLKDLGMMGMAVKKKDENRNINRYYIKTIVVTDSSVYDTFFTMATSTNYEGKIKETTTKIRTYFLHVMNEVDMRFKGIQNAGIEINVLVRSLVILQKKDEFKHNVSKVGELSGIKVIKAEHYLEDLKQADLLLSRRTQSYDQFILFTKYKMYGGPNNKGLKGHSVTGGICEPGRRVQICTLGDFFQTVSSAAHELGHALGAVDDGSGSAISCYPNDHYIMTPELPHFIRNKPYSTNPWHFSKCSVEAFLPTLLSKACLKGKGEYSQAEINELEQTRLTQPGVLFSPHDQCHIVNGPGSHHSGPLNDETCLFMLCTAPTTGISKHKFIIAATGTNCGVNKNGHIKKVKLQQEQGKAHGTIYQLGFKDNGTTIKIIIQRVSPI